MTKRNLENKERNKPEKTKVGRKIQNKTKRKEKYQISK